jgi:YfiH family protein
MGLTDSSDPEAVMQRRERLAQEVGFDLFPALLAVQVHGANVMTFSRSRPEGGQCVLRTDGLATDVPGQALITYHADCLPILFLDPGRAVVGAAHAGWRGALGGVAVQMVQALHLAYGSRPEELQVLIGPGICRACYQVGPEVAEPIAERYQRRERYLSTDREGRALLDLNALTQLQLEDSGVEPEHIQQTGWCTREDDRWFSHRGGRSGRFLAAIVAPAD